MAGPVKNLGAIMLLALLAAGGCTSKVGSLSVSLVSSCRGSDDPLGNSAESLRVSVFDSEEPVGTPQQFRISDGSATLTDIPAGPGVVIAVEGLSPEGKVVSRGRTVPLEVRDGTTNLDLYIGLVERFSQTAATRTSNRCTLNNGRTFHGASLLPSGSVLLTGGSLDPWRPEQDETPRATASVERIDGNALSIDTIECDAGECMDNARFQHTSTALATGNVLISGGLADGRDPSPPSPTEIYSAMEQRFFLGPPLTTDRSAHQALTQNSSATLAGGRGPTGSLVAEVESFENGEFRRISRMAQPRRDFALVSLPDGTLLATGGMEDAEGQPLASTELLRPGENRWQRGPDLAVPRAWHTATVLSDGTVLLVGGLTGAALATATVERFVDGQASEVVAELNLPRWAHTATRLNDGRILVAGGFAANRDGSPIRMVEQITIGATDLVNTSMCCGAGLIKPRAGHTATLLPSGWLLVAGGVTETGASTTADNTAEVFIY